MVTGASDSSRRFCRVHSLAWQHEQLAIHEFWVRWITGSCRDLGSLGLKAVLATLTSFTTAYQGSCYW